MFSGREGSIKINLLPCGKILKTSEKSIKLDKLYRRITLGDITTDNTFIADADDGMWMGSSSQDDAPFAVSLQGALTASAGKIGGWVINGAHLKNSANTFKLEPNGQHIISSSKFVVSLKLTKNS